MRPDGAIDGLLWDMRAEARRLQEFIAGKTFEQFVEDQLLQAGVKFQIETIGELATHVSRSYQEFHPEVPWADIIGQRNIIAHGYGKVDLSLIWRSSTVSVPALIDSISSLLRDA